jgi:hypothetical protein
LQNKKKIKALVACIIPPKFVLSNLLCVVPLPNATLQNTKNKNNQCNKQTATTNARMRTSKLKQ